MANLFFYSLTILIWGSTWLAITFQLGSVPPIQSVFYRFALAALLLFGWCLLRRLPLRFSLREHGYVAMQGVCLFALNYLGFYLSEQWITSGLAAVVFSTIVIMNTLNSRWLLGTPLEWPVLLGGGCGLLGLSLLFWGELVAVDFSAAVLKGLFASLIATYLASLGNILSARNQKNRLPIIQTNAFGMAYGALCMLLLAVLDGTPFRFELTASYVLSLGYLALFGSVIAFGCYLSLVGRIGPGRAAYATLLFPLVALFLSTFWEGYQWTPQAVLGISLIGAGNYFAMRRRKPSPLLGRLGVKLDTQLK